MDRTVYLWLTVLSVSASASCADDYGQAISLTCRSSRCLASEVAKWRILYGETLEPWLEMTVSHEAVVSDDQSVV